jgi:RimJ/RimL family protein N-acetyltransferase
MFYLETERLKLIPLDLYHLRLLRQSRALMEKSLGLEPSAMAVDDFTRREIAQALETWIAQVSNYESEYQWCTVWEIVLKDENFSIGGIGLTGPPDSIGETMVGYNIDGNYQNQGFASEALAGLTEWAFRHPRMRRLLAETPQDHFASHRVLSKNGFVKTGRRPGTFMWQKPVDN